jgi:hypothetical protein
VELVLWASPRRHEHDPQEMEQLQQQGAGGVQRGGRGRRRLAPAYMQALYTYGSAQKVRAAGPAWV